MSQPEYAQSASFMEWARYHKGEAFAAAVLGYGALQMVSGIAETTLTVTDPPALVEHSFGDIIAIGNDQLTSFEKGVQTIGWFMVAGGGISAFRRSEGMR